MESATLPGAELVAKGVEDLAHGLVTVEALLVSIGAPRLRPLFPGLAPTLPDADLRLYALLKVTHGDGAHGRYNALLRRLVSFQRAACGR
jgi:hypothetical protein